MEIKQVFTGWIEQLLDLNRRNPFLYLKKYKAQIDLDEAKGFFEKESFLKKLSESSQPFAEIDILEFFTIPLETEIDEKTNENIEKSNEVTTTQEIETSTKIESESEEIFVEDGEVETDEVKEDSEQTIQNIQDERGQQMRRLLEDLDDN